MIRKMTGGEFSSGELSTMFHHTPSKKKQIQKQKKRKEGSLELLEETSSISILL
jgi:hypothetical protein